MHVKVEFELLNFPILANATEMCRKKIPRINGHIYVYIYIYIYIYI
jgi:hypothetical protein